jgi:hypothetical protein
MIIYYKTSNLRYAIDLKTRMEQYTEQDSIYAYKFPVNRVWFPIKCQPLYGDFSIGYGIFGKRDWLVREVWKLEIVSQSIINILLFRLR